MSEIEIWDCDAFAIEDAKGEIIFAGRCKVEFTPPGPGSGKGSLWAPDLALDGREVRLEIEGISPTAPAPQPGFYFAYRVGKTLWGHDDRGLEFTWYVGSDAERALQERGVAVNPGVGGPEDMENAT